MTKKSFIPNWKIRENSCGKKNQNFFIKDSWWRHKGKKGRQTSFIRKTKNQKLHHLFSNEYFGSRQHVPNNKKKSRKITSSHVQLPFTEFSEPPPLIADKRIRRPKSFEEIRDFFVDRPKREKNGKRLHVITSNLYLWDGYLCTTTALVVYLAHVDFRY